jgi:hypothetical protein
MSLNFPETLTLENRSSCPHRSEATFETRFKVNQLTVLNVASVANVWVLYCPCSPLLGEIVYQAFRAAFLDKDRDQDVIDKPIKTNR